MTDLPSLISRFEAASGPDRDLDRALLDAFGIVVREFDPGDGDVMQWREWADGTRVVNTHVTASLDAITALIERVFSDREWGVFQDLENKRYTAQIGNDNWDEAFDVLYSHAPTPALALCLALVRAKAAMMEQSE